MDVVDVFCHCRFGSSSLEVVNPRHVFFTIALGARLSGSGRHVLSLSVWEQLRESTRHGLSLLLSLSFLEQLSFVIVVSIEKLSESGRGVLSLSLSLSLSFW